MRTRGHVPATRGHPHAVGLADCQWGMGASGMNGGGCHVRCACGEAHAAESRWTRCEHAAASTGGCARAAVEPVGGRGQGEGSNGQGLPLWLTLMLTSVNPTRAACSASSRVPKAKQMNEWVVVWRWPSLRRAGPIAKRSPQVSFFGPVADGFCFALRVWMLGMERTRWPFLVC